MLLRRPLDRLPLDGRPISQERGLERLASERGPLYESWADLAIDCTGNAMSEIFGIAEFLRRIHLLTIFFFAYIFLSVTPL